MNNVTERESSGARGYKTQAEYLDGLRRVVQLARRLHRLRRPYEPDEDMMMVGFPRESAEVLAMAGARWHEARRVHEARAAATRAAGTELPIDRLAAERGLSEQERQLLEVVLVEMTELGPRRRDGLELSNIALYLGNGDPVATQEVVRLILPGSKLMQGELLNIRAHSPLMREWQVSINPGIFETLLNPKTARVDEQVAQELPCTGPAATSIRAYLDEQGLVLEPDVLESVEQFFVAAQGGDGLLSKWGFDDGTSGCVALFHGPSGTGKTMTARALAGALGRKLHITNFAKIYDCFVGETEKAIVRMFARARKEGAVLLIDEADALLGRRGEITRAVDRHFNSEVNTVLVELEKHDGLVILTTNHADLLDPALPRRIRYKVLFGAPGVEARAKLWRAKFPAAAPLAADVDFVALGAEYALTGGQIANAARNAAVAVAVRSGDGRSPEISMADIRPAAERELNGCRTERRQALGFEGSGS